VHLGLPVIGGVSTRHLVERPFRKASLTLKGGGTNGI